MSLFSSRRQTFGKFILGAVITFIGCDLTQAREAATGPVDSVSIACGSRKAEISFRVSGPEKSDKFAIFLSGSPATSYFAEQIQSFMMLYFGFALPKKSDPYYQMTEELTNRGYRVLEARYENKPRMCGSAGAVEGFYSACCQQGLKAVRAHSEAFYDEAIHALGYEPENSSHRLVGFGWSLGAIQLQAMSFMSGKRFDKVALTGVLFGNPEQGCASGRTRTQDGMSWSYFMNLADSLTESSLGCSSPLEKDFEFSDEYRFERLEHKLDFELGLFEGAAWKTDMLTSPANFLGATGNPQQVEYIVRARTGDQSLEARTEIQTVGNTTWKLYPGCGHEILYCSQKSAFNDIVEFLDVH